jgi:ATP-dependent DNA helicase HFM1/MER3
MARYYLQFETMRNFLALPPRAKISEILSALTQAAEFKDIRFRSGEKPVYKELNKNSSIKFPIPVNIDLTAHKVSLVIQSILGGIELPDENGKHRVEYNTCKSTIFQHGHRLIRCIVDCQLHLNDSTSARNALMLARSLASQVWDDSPLTLKQLEGIGIVAVRKLANNDVRSIEDLETTEPHRIETMLSRNPPFGTLVQNRAKAFPKLRIEMKAMGEPIVKKGECVTLNVKAEIGFMNEQIPEMFQRKPIYVCVLVETSDGRKSYFARVSAKKLNRGQDVLFSADLTAASQVVRGYIMCDEIAGTQRIATLKPDIPAFMFPTPQRVEELNKQRTASTTVPITTKLRAESGSKPRPVDDDRDGPGANVLNELDLTEADDFVNINDLDENGNMRSNSSTKGAFDSAQPTSFKEPVRLENGKWACNHPCKNKSACKHTCCKEGTDNKPKPPKAKAPKKADSGADLKQTQLDVSRTKKPGTSTVAISSSMDLSIAPRQKSDSSKEVKSLNQLHDNTVNSTRPILLLGNSRSTDETTLSTFRPAQTFLGSGRPASTSKDDDDFSDDFGLEDFDPDDFLLGLDPQGPAEKKGGSQAVDLNEEDMLDFDPEDELVAFEHPSTEDAVDTMNSPFVEDECEMAPATTWSDDGRMYNEGDDESENVGHSAQHEAPSSSEPGSVNLINSKSRDKGLFVTGESSDTASNQQPSSSSTARSESSQKRNLDFDDFIDADVSLRPIKKPKQFSEDTTALPGNDFFDEVAASAANKEKEKSDEDDDAGKWFKEMFGTEMFEYVG